MKICDGRQRAIARLLLLVAITTTSAACDSIRELSFTPVFRGNSAPGPVPRDGYGRPILTPQEKAKIGIASGFLIAALHTAGLVTLTHTPSPMAFLNEICGRPENEKPYILLVCGYPAENCQVPEHGGKRRPFDAAVSWL